MCYLKSQAVCSTINKVLYIYLTAASLDLNKCCCEKKNKEDTVRINNYIIFFTK